jgi:lipoprotein-anchoring transpeptidase ErfK/SrfK
MCFVLDDQRARLTGGVLFIFSVVALLLPQQLWGQRPRSAAPAKPRSGPVARLSGLNISRINNANSRDLVAPRSRGNAVVRAEILLDRLKFSPGEITDTYNDNLGNAVKAFQSGNGLPASGVVDSATWTALNARQSAGETQAGGDAQKGGPPTRVIIPYVISNEDVAGPFTKLPRVTGRDAGEQLMLREAKLEQLNYESLLELLAEKFHSSTRLLVELNPRKTFSKAGAELQVPDVQSPPPTDAASVVVDASTRTVTALAGDGKVLAFYPATVGSVHDPLPVGTWKVVEVTWYPHFKYNPNRFWDAENKNARAVLPPGPNNPVGIVWIGLSKEHYGIHGTPQPSRIGVTESHGCIRLTNWDAGELGKMVHVGTPVVLQGTVPPIQSKK